MSTWQVHWAIANVVSITPNDDNTFYCFSEAEAAIYHPSDVPVWQCESAVSSSNAYYADPGRK